MACYSVEQAFLLPQLIIQTGLKRIIIGTDNDQGGDILTHKLLDVTRKQTLKPKLFGTALRSEGETGTTYLLHVYEILRCNYSRSMKFFHSQKVGVASY